MQIPAHLHTHHFFCFQAHTSVILLLDVRKENYSIDRFGLDWFQSLGGFINNRNALFTSVHKGYWGFNPSEGLLIIETWGGKVIGDIYQVSIPRRVY